IMSTLFQIVILLTSVSDIFGQNVRCEGAGQKCAVVFSTERCQDKSISFEVNELVRDLATRDFDNTIVSVSVTRNCALLLYDGVGYMGNARMYLGNIGAEQYYKVDKTMRNAASSARCRCNITHM
ncbi:hypothetical protein PMAYCL1PPCAC_25276, partial [Pristionchus mayeri]